ncbi:helix-turn-helix domain-containing protein [Kitasatospora purpeofusca]|uniref:helix-turn-helix domain-containing protein n=1 Tax=Kitasatospora purpeofusca TaxID=67352 RepID=UPI002259612D|nr:helix-turn-helix domain-containing protein [Kitasatospora purpeofusca]MCX4754284.1 helix-turn-helix domain-containing protein [Kitasatospora purpeofusca]WSR33716.1 helix-turn-helix domain-containing protein [Kitasatospora purpeofusca]
MTVPTATIQPVLLTAEDVAKMMRIGRSTVYELLSGGELASIKIGRSRRIRPADVHAYIERQATAT